MDDQTMALNESEEQKELDTTPVSNTVPEEVEEPRVESTEEAQSESTETEEAPKKGASQRISELTKERDEWKAKAETKSLADRLAENTGSIEPQQQFIPQDLGPIVNPGEEIDGIELDRRLRERETRILQNADAVAQLRSKQEQAVTRVQNEAQEVVRKYPELDPNNDSYNKELSDSIFEATDAFIKANPYSASVKSFVDKLMKPYQRAVSKEVGKAQENIAKQVSQAALRPTSVTKQEKSVDDMSAEELEAKLGIVQA